MKKCEINKLVAEGKTGEALESISLELSQICDNYFLSRDEMDYLLLNNRFHKIKSDYQLNIISRDEYFALENKISNSLLELVNAEN